VNTAIERPTINGSMEMVERREQVTRTTPNSQIENTAVYTRNTNGDFAESARSTVERTTENGTSVENAANYELGKLVKQTVSKTVRQGDTEVTQEDVFLANMPGVVRSADETRPQLQQRKLIERSFSANGSKEIVRMQTPVPGDPNRMSSPRKVEETVCTGKCGAPPPDAK